MVLERQKLDKQRKHLDLPRLPYHEAWRSTLAGLKQTSSEIDTWEYHENDDYLCSKVFVESAEDRKHLSIISWTRTSSLAAQSSLLSLIGLCELLQCEERNEKLVQQQQRSSSLLNNKLLGQFPGRKFNFKDCCCCALSRFFPTLLHTKF